MDITSHARESEYLIKAHDDSCRNEFMLGQGNTSGKCAYSSTIVSMYSLWAAEGNGPLKSILNRSMG